VKRVGALLRSRWRGATLARALLIAALGMLVVSGCSSGEELGSSGTGGAVGAGGLQVAGTGGALVPVGSGGHGAVATGGAAVGVGGAMNGAGGNLGPGSGGELGAGGSGGGAADPGELVPVTVFLAGDSTVSAYTDTASTTDQAGWGQMLPELLDALATVDNRAIGGRTARRFIDDGALGAIWEDSAAGDYLLVQFGTNDGNKTATYTVNGETIPYYLDPATDFKAYLMQYVDGARERDVIPVFVTPPPRNSAYCTGGNGTGGHAQAMRELGAAEAVPVLDLNARSVAYLTGICPAPTPEDFFLLRTDGSVDGTHFQENGARKLAGMVVEELATTELFLANYVK